MPLQSAPWMVTEHQGRRGLDLDALAPAAGIGLGSWDVMRAERKGAGLGDGAHRGFDCW